MEGFMVKIIDPNDKQNISKRQLLDQRIIDGVDKLNRARGRRRKCTDPDNPRFGRYI